MKIAYIKKIKHILLFFFCSRRKKLYTRTEDIRHSLVYRDDGSDLCAPAEKYAIHLPRGDLQQ